MAERTFLITAPRRVLTFTPDGNARSISWSTWLSEVRWSGHYARLADGRVTSVDHCRYRGDGPPALDRDETGRLRLWLDRDAFLALAASGGVTGDHVAKLFEHRTDAEAAWRDLWQWGRAVQVEQEALARAEH